MPLGPWIRISISISSRCPMNLATLRWTEPHANELYQEYNFNVLSRLDGVFGLDIGFIDHLRIATSSNYNSLKELHTPNTTVTTGHIKSSLTSLDVSW
jgi:hypothetical protein